MNSKIPQKESEKEPYYTWTKHYGWKINGYLNKEKNGK